MGEEFVRRLVERIATEKCGEVREVLLAGIDIQTLSALL